MARAQPGSYLQLAALPDQDETAITPCVHLIARPVFLIGRHPNECHLVTWMLPRSETNDARTNRISRIHAWMERRNGTLWLLDNNTANETSYNSARILPEQPVEFDRRGIIVLANDYFIDTIPFTSDNATYPEEVNLPVLPFSPAAAERCSFGAVRFYPINNACAFHEAVWCFQTAHSAPGRRILSYST